MRRGNTQPQEGVQLRSGKLPAAAVLRRCGFDGYVEGRVGLGVMVLPGPHRPGGCRGGGGGNWKRKAPSMQGKGLFEVAS